MNYQLIADKIEGILDELFISISDENYALIYKNDDVDRVMFKLFKVEE